MPSHEGSPVQKTVILARRRTTPSLEGSPVEKTVILAFAVRLRLHSKLHFLANSGLKHVLLVCTD